MTSLADQKLGNSKRMSFQRDPASVSPRGLFDHVTPAGNKKFLMAAVAAFAGRGYHATTTRDIAQMAGSSPAGIYTYYATKADLLYDMSIIAHEYVLEQVIEAANGAEDPVERIKRIVRASVTYHAEEHVVAKVVNKDFQALDVSRLAKILKSRKSFTKFVRSELRAGMDKGIFSIEDLDGTTIAILRLMDVSPWYNERGSMSPDELADTFTVLILRMIGVPPGSARTDERDAAVDR